MGNDASRSEWDKLRQRAGFHTSDTDSETSSMSNGEWKHSTHGTRVHSHVKDHLYNLIDLPGRDRGKHELFGMAKSFPEVTRNGYRDFLETHLKNKHQEASKEDADVKTSQSSDEETAAAPEKHKYAFNVRDFGPVYRFRIMFHAELAEFLGMIVFLAIGFASDCQALVGGTKKATYTTTVLTWGFGQMAGIYVAGGYSGAHLNPVLTMNLWFFRGFPLRRMLSFWVAQFFGAFVAAAWIFLLYYPALRKLDPDGWSLSTGGAFYTLPADDVPVISCWFNEVTCTALLHIIIFAVGDSHNISPARGMNALVLGSTVTALGSAFGYLSPFGMNPWRDFAPRIFLSMVGFPKQLWTVKHWWWVTGLFTGPLLGGFLGAWAYDLFIFDGPESPVNFPKGVKRRAIKFWFNNVLHPLQHHTKSNAVHRLQEGGYDENPYRGTVHLQGQPAQ